MVRGKDRDTGERGSSEGREGECVNLRVKVKLGVGDNESGG